MPRAPSGPEEVALLGVGTMGHAMGASALRAGLPLVVWDRNPERLRDLTELGAEPAGTAAEAASRAGIVVTMVSDLPAVLSIALDQGVLEALAPGAIWAQMSTIGTGIDRVAALVGEQRPDVTLVDAPVSGSREPAERGELTILASGPDLARSRLAPLFDALGQRTMWVGPAGAGSRLKLVMNTLLAFKAEGLATAVALGRTLGLDTGAMIEGLSAGPLVSPWDTAKLQRIGGDDFTPQFSLSLALKDVRLALEAADSGRFACLEALAQEWGRAVAEGLGGEDLTVVTRFLEDS